MPRFMPLIALLLPSLASAVPMQFTHQGRLHDAAGLPIDGSCSLDMGIYTAPSGGAAVWQDTITTSCDNGYYAITLGSGTPLDAADFDGSTLYLEMG